MKTSFKAILATALIFVSALMLTGCGEQEVIPWYNEDGTLKAVTKDQLSKDGIYYIKRGDEYYRIPSHGITDSESGKNIVWFTDKYETYYPTLKKGDELIYLNTAERPTKTNFILYEDAGYTIGAKFKTNKENTDVEISVSNIFCDDSPIQSYIDKNMYDKQDVRIMEINNKKFSPNKIDSLGFVHNLTKNAMYKLSFYMGTVYSSVNVRADTHLYIEAGRISSTKYIEQKDLYYTVVLPEDMCNGFYTIGGNYAFFYDDEDNVALPVDLITKSNEEAAAEEAENSDGTSDTENITNEQDTETTSFEENEETYSEDIPAESEITTTITEENNSDIEQID